MNLHIATCILLMHMITRIPPQVCAAFRRPDYGQIDESLHHVGVDAQGRQYALESLDSSAASRDGQLFHKVMQSDDLDRSSLMARVRSLPHEPTVHENRSNQLVLLGFVTPWNSRGYEIAEALSTRLSHISPVWLQLQAPSNKITGLHDVDRDWMERVKLVPSSTSSNAAGETRRVMPRLIFEGFTGEDWAHAVKNPNQIAELISDIAYEYDFDGIVLELQQASKFQLVQHLISKNLLRPPRQRNTYPDQPPDEWSLCNLVAKIAEEMHHFRRQIAIAASPHAWLFSEDDWRFCGAHVDMALIMTYDYADGDAPRPNAPLSWSSSVMMRLVKAAPGFAHKLLMGLHFYGRDFTDGDTLNPGEAIIGNQFVELLERYLPPLRYDDEFHEHYIKYTSDKGVRRTAFYPTQESVRERMAVVEKLGLGGAFVWEVGQGTNDMYQAFVRNVPPDSTASSR